MTTQVDPRLAIDGGRPRSHLSSGYTDDMTATRSTVLDRLTSLADPTRSRILVLLDRHELTVSELCTVLQLPQSTVSRHLKLLADDGWIVSRGEGTSRFYRMLANQLDPEARELWQVVRSRV